MKEQGVACDDYNILCSELQPKKGLAKNAFIHDTVQQHLQDKIEKKKAKLSKIRGIPSNTEPLKKHNTRKHETEKLCDYELKRRDNIQKNNEILVKKGIEKEETLNHQAKRPRKQTSSSSVSNMDNDTHKMNLRSYLPETTNECSFFSDRLDMLKKSRRKSRVKQDLNDMTSSHEPSFDKQMLNNFDEDTLEEEMVEEVSLKEATLKEASLTNLVDSKLNETMIDDDTTYSANVEDGSEIHTNNLMGDEYKDDNTATNTFPQPNLQTTSNEERNVTTNQDKIEDITCLFEDETDLCNIETKDLSNALIQSFPIIKSTFAKSGYKGVHKTKLGWLVQINMNRDNLTKDHQMCFCGIYKELAMATFVFSMISQKLFLASSIDFLYKSLNNLKFFFFGKRRSATHIRIACASTLRMTHGIERTNRREPIRTQSRHMHPLVYVHCLQSESSTPGKNSGSLYES